MVLAQDQVQLRRVVKHRAVRVLRGPRRHREAPVEVRHELRQVRVARLDVADAAQPHLLHQTILQGPIGALHAPRLQPAFACGLPAWIDAMSSVRKARENCVNASSLSFLLTRNTLYRSE